MNNVRIAGIGTAVPPHVVHQHQVRSIIEQLLGRHELSLAHVLRVFEHEHVRTRRFVMPPEWYAEDHSFAYRNSVYSEQAVLLATEAAQKALDRSSAQVEAIVVASTTGIMTPSLDAALMQTLHLRSTCKRLPVFGLGCAAGVSGLARAAEVCAALNGHPVLFVAVEVCSTTFQKNDFSKSNIVGSSIFGDGAAAVLLSWNGTGPVVHNSYSTLFPSTEDIMGWDVSDDGLKVRFSRDIPAFVRENIPSILTNACAEWGIDLQNIADVIAHPGGSKVLDAYAAALGRTPPAFSIARSVLQEFGNMSSASVLFVLERWLQSQQRTKRSGYSLMAALGPGFSAEQVLLFQP